MDDGHAIPAATVQDVDLSGVADDLATEIVRLGDRMERGDETPEEFARLIRLLIEAEHTSKAEHLMRRNYEVVAGGLALYHELFGTQKRDEFAAAVESFASQFGVGLKGEQRQAFLVSQCRVEPGPPRSDAFSLLSQPCEVRFGYIDQDSIEADVWSVSDDQYLLLRWVDGAWQLS